MRQQLYNPTMMRPKILMLFTNIFVILLGSCIYTISVDVPVPTLPPAQQQHFEWNDKYNGRAWIDNSAVESLINENRTLSPTLMLTLAPHYSRRPQASPTHAPTFVANSSLTEQEYNALYDLYYSTNGPYWNWNGSVFNLPDVITFDPLDFPDSVPWDFSKYDLSSPCVDRWDGITCSCADPLPDGDIYCYVIGLSLPAHNVTGTLPESLTYLQYLEELDFLDNRLSSTIPSFMGKFAHLQKLSLAYNYFSGTLTESLSNLTKLTDLHLYRNELNGKLPESYCTRLTNLVTLELSHNRLSGTITPNISNLRELKFLSLNNNRFHGQVPVEIGSLKKLLILDLGINRLSGQLPLSVTSIPSLVQLYLHSNLFYGNIPVEYGYFPEIATLFFGNNFLTGSIPLSFLNLRRLRNFDCQYNSLEGNLSAVFLHRPNLVNLYFQQNAFTGPLIPNHGTEIEYRTLVTFSCYNNFLTGTVSSQLASSSYMNFLDLGQNVLHGTIPPWVSDLRHLTYLYLNDNAISGSIAVDFGIKIIFLVELYLDHNKLTGSLPDTLGLLHLLVELNMHGNEFVGTIPDLLVSSLRLRTVILRNNYLTGTLPNFGYFHNRSILQNLDVSDNGLTGTIHPDIFKLENLQTLILSGNCFHGSISDDVCESKSLINIEMEGISTADACQSKLFPHIPYFNSFSSDTPLVGTIPPCIFNMPSVASLYISGNGLQGSLPSDLVVSPTLTDLSLAYNLLSSSIPLSIQERYWATLDLSNNKFSGTISEHIYGWNSSNASLSLDVNRLSGRVPEALWYSPSINILNGNIFQCNFQESNLPQHDPTKSKYSCGSDAIDRSIYLWMVIWFIVGVIIILLAYKFSVVRLRDVSIDNSVKDDIITSRLSVESQAKGQSESMTFWQHVNRSGRFFNQVLVDLKQITNNPDNKDNKDILIERFCKLLGVVRYLFLIITLFILICLMPVYGLLSVWESMYEYTYSWSISAILLSGEASGAMLCFGFTCSIVVVIYLYEMHVLPFQQEIRKKKRDRSKGSGDVADTTGWDWLTKRRVRTSSDYDGKNDNSKTANSKHRGSTGDDDGSADHKLSEVSLSESVGSVGKESMVGGESISATDSISLESSPCHSRSSAPVSSDGDASSNERLVVRLATHTLGFVNFILMIWIDIVYVYVAISANARQVLVVQFLLSIFKISWNEVALWRMYPSLKIFMIKALGKGAAAAGSGTVGGGSLGGGSIAQERRGSFDPETSSNFGDNAADPNVEDTTYSNSDSLSSTFQFSINELNFLVYTVILNNVIIPCMAIAVVSPHCFYNAFFEAPPTEQSTIYGCEYILTIGTTTKCVGQQSYVEDITYNTPFNYRYECSAAFSIKFTAVYIFMFIIVGLLIPLIHIITRVLYYRYRSQYLQGKLENRFSRFIYLVCKAILPNRLKRLAPNPPKIKNFKLLANDRSIVRYSSYLAILLSFGILFPPLGVIAFVSIYTVTYFEQYCIARIVSDAKKMGYSWYKIQIAKECENIPESWYDSLWIILPFAGFTYACVIFDTIGDQHGWKAAAGPSIFVFFLPALFYVSRIISQKLCVEMKPVIANETDNLETRTDVFQKMFNFVVRVYSVAGKRTENAEATEIELNNTRVTMSDAMDEHRDTQYFGSIVSTPSMITNPMTSDNFH